MSHAGAELLREVAQFSGLTGAWDAVLLGTYGALSAGRLTDISRCCACDPIGSVGVGGSSSSLLAGPVGRQATTVARRRCLAIPALGTVGTTAETKEGMSISYNGIWGYSALLAGRIHSR